MLRATYRKKQYAKLSTRPTLQNQIKELRTQINRQKPETQFYRLAQAHQATSVNPETNHYNITNSLITAADFRQNVTGDKWTNLYLKLNVVASATCDALRVLVYVPKIAGTRATPSVPFAGCPDPSAFTMLADYHVNQESNADRLKGRQKWISLRRIKTIYDSQAANIERGEVIVTVLSWAQQFTTAFDIGYCLAYHNN